MKLIFMCLIVLGLNLSGTAIAAPQMALIKGNISVTLILKNGSGVFPPMPSSFKEDLAIKAGKTVVPFEKAFIVEECSMQDQNGCEIATATKTIELSEVILVPGSKPMKLAQPIVYRIKLNSITAGHLQNQELTIWAGVDSAIYSFMTGQGASTHTNKEASDQSLWSPQLSYSGDAIPVQLNENPNIVAIVPSISVYELRVK